MAISVKQRGPARGQSGANGQAEVPYLVICTENEEYAAARAALQTEVPAQLDNLYLDHVALNPNGIDYATNRQWEGFARYLAPNLVVFPQAGEVGFSFATSGATQHITQAKEHIATHAASGHPAISYNGAIGVTETGEVEGTDIIAPESQFNIVWAFQDGDVTDAYKRTIASLVGRCNSAPFRGYEAGELRFDGAQGQKRGDGFTEIAFTFSVSLNATGLTVGGISGIAKKGWEYLWAEYKRIEDTSAKLLISRPIRVHVERVYDPGDFAALAIGS